MVTSVRKYVLRVLRTEGHHYKKKWYRLRTEGHHTRGHGFYVLGPSMVIPDYVLTHYVLRVPET
jgi:hypothetical protein